MKKEFNLKKNFAYQMIYELLVFILPFITSPYISRVIGAEGLGIYSYSYSIAYYFVLFSLLGIKNYGNRAIARARDDQETLDSTFSSLFIVHLIISIIFCVAYVLYILIKKENQLYAALQLFYVLSGLFDISWFYFGIEHFKLTVTRNIIIRIINVLCVFLFVKTDNDLWKYCLIMSFGQLISQCSLWIPLKKYVHYIKPTWIDMKVHIKPLIILFIPAIAVSLYKYMDKIMLGMISSKTELGYYENAEKVVNIPTTIIASFGTVMLPKMSNLVATTNNSIVQKYIAISMKYVMWLAFALAFGLAAVGKTFAPIFWGAGFEYSGTIIMYLSLTIPFISFANVIRTQYLIPNERDKSYLISVSIGAIVNFIVNSLLIPKQGAIGAAIGTICAEITVCLIQTFAVRKELSIYEYFKNFKFFIIVGLGMFVIVYYIGDYLELSVLSVLVQVLTGVLVYTGITIIYFIYHKDKIVLNLIYKLPFISHKR